MKRLLLVALFLAIVAGTAFAQPRPGMIGISADPDGTSCNIYDAVPGLVSMYVVHLYGEEVTSSTWVARTPLCNAMTYLQDTAVFPGTSGNSQTGVTIQYGACWSSPIHILTVNWIGQGTTPDCCPFVIVPHPLAASGQIETDDCDSNLMYATGFGAHVNPSGNCINCWTPFPVEETTWGQVKALYR